VYRPSVKADSAASYETGVVVTASASAVPGELAVTVGVAPTEVDVVFGSSEPPQPAANGISVARATNG
jgi:hypothetical protein